MCDCDIGMCTGDHWGDTVRGSGLLQEEAASVLLAATVPLSRKIPPGNFTARGKGGKGPLLDFVYTLPQSGVSVELYE